jgi:capsular exopolysaccharide synthesis family protein
MTLGVVVAFVMENWQETFRGAEIQNVLNIPLLGMLPAVAPKGSTPSQVSRRIAAPLLPLTEHNVWGHRRRRDDGWFRLDRDSSHSFELSESIRNLRTSLLFAVNAKALGSILISSAVPAEGKTTVSCNLAISLAQMGNRVLLIDADLRRPCVRAYFGVPDDFGLTEYLEHGGDWHTITQAVNIPGLQIITSGKSPNDPVELLSTDRMKELINTAKAEYDFVIVDSPTLVTMADSRVLARYVDGALLIVKSASTPRFLVREACDNLHSVSARVIGLVLNHVDRTSARYSYDSYYRTTERGAA